MAVIDKTGAAALIKDFRAALVADPDLYLDRSTVFRRSQEYAKARPVGAHDAHVEKALDHAQAPADRRRQDTQDFAERMDAIDRGERYAPPVHRDPRPALHDQHVYQSSFDRLNRDFHAQKVAVTKETYDKWSRDLTTESRLLKSMENTNHGGSLREGIYWSREKIKTLQSDIAGVDMARARDGLKPFNQTKETSIMTDITKPHAPSVPGADVNADIARRMREKADHDNRARLIKDESRRIEKMQDALRAGGLGAQGSKALREQIDKARQKINAVRAEHEQAEMKRIKERADARDREEARATTRPQPYVGTDYTGVAKSREAVEGVRSFTSGNDKGAKDAREARNEKHEKAEADADQKASQEARDDIRAAKRAARDAGAGI